MLHVCFQKKLLVRNSIPRSQKNRETNLLARTDCAEGFSTQNLITLRDFKFQAYSSFSCNKLS